MKKDKPVRDPFAFSLGGMTAIASFYIRRRLLTISTTRHAMNGSASKLRQCRAGRRKTSL